jgi:hypothetical protein
MPLHRQDYPNWLDAELRIWPRMRLDAGGRYLGIPRNRAGQRSRRPANRGRHTLSLQGPLLDDAEQLTDLVVAARAIAYATYRVCG